MTNFQQFQEGAQRHPYLSSIAAILVVTAIGFTFEPILHAANLDMLYALAVFASALYFDERPAIFTAILGAVAFNFCFIQPRFRWGVTDLPYLVTLLVFVIIGVTTARLAAQVRQRLRDQAARDRAEALSASKDELLHKISHELRSPMTAIVGWTQFLQMTTEGPGDVADAVKGLAHGTQVLQRLVEDLFDASRASAGKLVVQLQPTMLAPVVSRAIDLVAISGERKHLSIGRSLDDVCVAADEIRIEQIVTNLLTNAIKFTPVGGRITVSLTCVQGKARMSVSDTGPGIPNELLPHLFEPFTQAEIGKRHGGMGLGLSIVKSLVEAHGGTIEVASDREGTTFVVTLPMISDEMICGAPGAAA